MHITQILKTFYTFVQISNAHIHSKLIKNSKYTFSPSNSSYAVLMQFLDLMQFLETFLHGERLRLILLLDVIVFIDGQSIFVIILVYMHYIENNAWMCGNVKFISNVDQDISPVSKANKWDILFKTRNKFLISKHLCILF